MKRASGTRMPKGGAWLQAREVPLVLVFPDLPAFPVPPGNGTLKFAPDEDPMALYWPVAGMECTVRWPEYDSGIPVRVARALLRDGSIGVTVVAGRRGRLALSYYGAAGDRSTRVPGTPAA